MSPYSYATAASPEAAVDDVRSMTAAATPAYTPDARGMTKFIAGGTNLLDLMKENVMRPSRLVDLNRLALAAIETNAEGGLSLGALVRNADTAYDPLVRARYPLLSLAILAGASPQIRNMASNGGNLLQRTRCYYFYDTGTPCNKRQPGSGCAALRGLTRIHAILGAGEITDPEMESAAGVHCIATHPSDMCVALAALDATVRVRSAHGTRSIPFADFHRLPESRPDLDSTLAPDELITHIDLPPASQFARHSAYLKIRDRASYAFALVSAAAALEFDAAGNILDARMAMGGVAHKPWRLREAELTLIGQPPQTAHFARAADLLLQGARSYGAENGNAYKIPMAHRAVVRALQMAASGTQGNKINDRTPDDTPHREQHTPGSLS